MGVARNLCWGRDNRGAEIEKPKASRGKGYGEGCPTPQPTNGSGERPPAGSETDPRLKTSVGAF